MTDTAQLLRSSDVVTAAGCTYRQLDHWASARYITPAAAEASGRIGRRPHRPVKDAGAPGQGRARLWHPDEVEVVRRMALLSRIGLPPIVAARAARTTGPIDLGHGIVLTAPWSKS